MDEVDGACGRRRNMHAASIQTSTPRQAARCRAASAAHLIKADGAAGGQNERLDGLAEESGVNFHAGHLHPAIIRPRRRGGVYCWRHFLLQKAGHLLRLLLAAAAAAAGCWPLLRLAAKACASHDEVPPLPPRRRRCLSRGHEGCALRERHVAHVGWCLGPAAPKCVELYGAARWWG